MGKELNKIDITIKIFFFLGLVILYFLVYSLNKNIQEAETVPETKSNLPTRILEQTEPLEVTEQEEVVQPQVVTQSCTELCVEEINEIVAEAIKSVPRSVETKVVEVGTISGSTVYVPLGGVTAVETSTDWVDVKGTDTYVNAKVDYGEGAKFSWEAFLKVAHGNGQAFARLYDDTNKIAVNGGELTTINNEAYQLVSSGNLNLWSGRNLYKVQVKSLNSFEVTYSGGRIIVSY